MNKFLPSYVCMFIIAIWSLFTVIPSTTCQAIAHNSILTKENLGKTTGSTPLVGTIEFIGTIQSITPSSVTVAMPDSQKLSMNIVQGQANLASLKSALPSVGQLVKATAIVNPDGSFTASKLALPTQTILQQ